MEQNLNRKFHHHVPFSKSYPETESTRPTAKCRGRNSSDTWYYIVTLCKFCVMLCVSFSLKSKAINVFPKHILKSKAGDQSNHARNKLFCQVMVKKYLSNVLLKILNKIKSTWRREIKEQAPQLTLLYRSGTVRTALEPIFKKLRTFRPATLFKRDPNTGGFLWILQNF